MVRDDQICPLANRLGGDRRRDRQASQHALDPLGPVADEQPDIVPLRSQNGRSELVQKIADGRERQHAASLPPRHLESLTGNEEFETLDRADEFAGADVVAASFHGLRADLLAGGRPQEDLRRRPGRRLRS